MVDKIVIKKVMDDIISKCGRRNNIPTIGANPNIIRFTKKERESMQKFIDENCGEGENYNPNEQLRFINAFGGPSVRGSFRYSPVNGEPDKISSENNELYKMILEDLYRVDYETETYGKPKFWVHEIHNHPKSGGLRDKMPECLSDADILGCLTSSWSKSITAVSGANQSKMIFMKGKDYVDDFETEAGIVTQAYKLSEAYFDYLDRWENEIRNVWAEDEVNGNIISKEVLNNLPKGTSNALNKVHEKYEEIAQENIGTFEESIKDIRAKLNTYNVDISIEW